MSSVVFVGDLVASNDKSLKESNFPKGHAISIGSLVEIRNTGVRLFVVNHSRNCDGEPLYDLSFDLDSQEKFTQAKNKIDQMNFKNQDELTLAKISYWFEAAKIDRHHSGNSLVVIR